MGMKSEIEAALLAHATWRKHFRDYLNGKGAFDLMTAGASHECDFGKWLDHEGHRLMPAGRHDEVRSAHEEFHQIVLEILQKIKEKRFVEAHRDIAADGALNRVSIRLANMLRKASLIDGPVTDVSSSPNEAAPDSPAGDKPTGSIPSAPPDNAPK